MNITYVIYIHKLLVYCNYKNSVYIHIPGLVWKFSYFEMALNIGMPPQTLVSQDAESSQKDPILKATCASSGLSTKHLSS